MLINTLIYEKTIMFSVPGMRKECEKVMKLFWILILCVHLFCFGGIAPIGEGASVLSLKDISGTGFICGDSRGKRICICFLTRVDGSDGTVVP